MSLVPIIFFLAGRLCGRASFIFAAGLTLRGHEADLFQACWLIISCHFCFLQDVSLMWCSFLWLWFEDHDILMMNLYYKEFAPLFQSKCWINYFIYAIFPCSDFLLLNFVLADSRITSGCNQKFVSRLLISSSSRPNLLCFGFDLNQSQCTIPISRNGYLPDCQSQI